MQCVYALGGGAPGSKIKSARVSHLFPWFTQFNSVLQIPNSFRSQFSNQRNTYIHSVLAKVKSKGGKPITKSVSKLYFWRKDLGQLWQGSNISWAPFYVRGLYIGIRGLPVDFLKRKKCLILQNEPWNASFPGTKEDQASLGKVGQRWQRLSSALLFPPWHCRCVCAPPTPPSAPPPPPGIVTDLSLPLVAFS